MKKLILVFSVTFLTCFSLILIFYGIFRSSDHQVALMVIGLIFLLFDLGFIYYTFKKGFWRD